MSHNFKPGDLALIVGGPCAGCCVDLISFHPGGSDVLVASGYYCYAHTASWRVAGIGLTAKFGNFPERRPVKDGLIGPELLMPLRGDFTPEQQKAKEAV
ncbi:hypothetical protein [Pseudomonas sp. BTN1]|uniref:hypothetical protein n=1 Tax=Pseudomonas sp. BTN1 TaxID=1750647 RepID=UPI0009389A4D|nr:hypothetical protein [Pseudomonas sp. BTN1]OKO50344.1 hypothetical protein BMH52_01245 [Pseudomonas sp. BTN1]